MIRVMWGAVWVSRSNRFAFNSGCQEMSAENQSRGQRDDHYRNVIALAGAIGAAVKDNRYC